MPLDAAERPPVAAEVAADEEAAAAESALREAAAQRLEQTDQPIA
jgi:hypothetical protein